MKIKAFLFAALLLAGVSAFAQEASEGETGKGPTDSFISHSFKDNWFIGGGIGFDFVVDGPFAGPRVGGGLDLGLNFGKWLDPMWGIRASFDGIWSSHADLFALGSSAVGAKDPYNFLFIHGDVMWNITNQFWGYKENRKYQFIPYLTAGLYWPFDRSKNFTAGMGILNKIRLSDRLDLDIDLTGIFVKQASIEQVNQSGGVAGVGFAKVGVSYKLGDNPGWQTKADALMPATVAVAEATAALAAAQAEKEQLAAEKEEAEAAQEEAAKENDALKQELAENAAQNEAIVKNLMETPAIVYFEIGQATLSVKELEHFDRIVKTMLSQDKEIKFTLTGLTDHNTGSAKRNQQLQKQRANYIHKLLADKYGLEKDQFEIIIDESAKNRFTTIELNRAVIIESAKAAEEAPAEEPAE